MAIRGINLIEEFRWSSTSDSGIDGDENNPKTVFIFGGVDATIRTMIYDNILVYSQTEDGRPANMVRTGLRNIELVRHMLRGVEHYSNPAGEAIPFTQEERFILNKAYKVATEHFISTIPPEIVNEMGEMLHQKLRTTGQALIKN